MQATSWIPWHAAGKVERLDREHIETEFFHVVIPIWPGRSYYVYVDRDGEPACFEIPRHRTSVVLGLLRTPLWLAALILGLPGLFDFERWHGLLPIAGVLAVIAALLTFGAGQLSPGERDRRALLRRVTGLGAPPELMPEDLREALCLELADAWFGEHETDWREAIHRGAASEQLVALAEYHRAPHLLIRARTNLIDLEGN